MSSSDWCLILLSQGSRFKSSNLNVSIEFSRKFFSAVYLFLIIPLMLFLFSNSSFPSCFWYGFLSGLTTARLNQSMVSVITVKVKKVHERIGSHFI